MDQVSSAVSTFELIGEVWDVFSGLEKAGIIAVGALMLLGAIAENDENTPNDPNDIPTWNQISEKQKQLDFLQRKMADYRSGTVSGANAEQWQKLTKEALERIKGYRHQMFAPGAVTEIREALASAEEFRSLDLNQAANQTLYQAWQLARKTELEVLDGEKLWEETAVEYLTCHGRLQKLFDTTGELSVEFQADQGKETLTMDADFWSQGRVSHLRNTMPGENLEPTVTVEYISHSTQQLREMANSLRQVILEATDAFRSSQQRMQLCQAVCDSFLERGWILDEAAENGFEKRDPREDAVLNLCSAARDKLEFRFSGATHIALKPRFQAVHNQGLRSYMENTLRQVLTENGFVLTELTSSI